jgi:hypothetical protein
MRRTAEAYEIRSDATSVCSSGDAVVKPPALLIGPFKEWF